MLSEFKARLFRPRSDPLSFGPSWEYELPEGKVATPAQLAEYRRRSRRAGLQTAAAFLGFIPLASWLIVSYVRNPTLEFASFAAVGLLTFLLLIGAQLAFRCPVCECQFGHERVRLSRMSPARREALFKFRWCDCCGTRFEVYPPSVPAPPEEEREGFGILRGGESFGRSGGLGHLGRAGMIARRVFCFARFTSGSLILRNGDLLPAEH